MHEGRAPAELITRRTDGLTAAGRRRPGGLGRRSSGAVYRNALFFLGFRLSRRLSDERSSGSIEQDFFLRRSFLDHRKML